MAEEVVGYNVMFDRSRGDKLVDKRNGFALMVREACRNSVVVPESSVLLLHTICTCPFVLALPPSRNLSLTRAMSSCS